MFTPPVVNFLYPRALFVSVACGCSLLVSSQTFAADPIREVSKTVGEWVNTRAETVRLEKKWDEERELLGSTVNGLKERADRLEEKRDQLLAATADEREELAGLAAKKDEAEKRLNVSEARLGELTAQLTALRPRLPPRLSDALEMAFRSLAGSTATPGERMQLVMTVLNRCAQFNASINHGEEVVRFDGDTTAKSVETIYWGLSHGYALDRAAGRAWLGTPGTDRWTWAPLEGAASAVAELIAVRLDESDPVLIGVPARLNPADPTGK